MKLIFIYGPPAVGKLTVAKHIAQQTGYKIFHNHLSVDLVRSIFTRDAPSFGALLRQIRFAVFAEDAKANISGLIFTMVYARNREDIIEKYLATIEQNGGQCCLVHLHCDIETLRQHVVEKEREQHGKITTVALLNQVLEELTPQEPFAPTQLRPSLSINTGQQTAAEAAKKIIAHYGLGTT